MLLAIFKSLFGSDGPDPDDQVRLDELEDSELMQRYADGDERAFALLFDRHRGPLYNFILRSCSRRDVAEELLQDVFLRVIKSAGRYEPSAKFTTWLYTIARNACIDAARSRSRADVYSLQNPVGKDDDEGETHQQRLADPEAQSGSVDAERKVFRDRLQQALEKLPEKQREVFVLREISGLKFREVAEVIGTKVPTVKSRMRYALKTLRGELADYRDHQFDDDEHLEMVP